VVGKKEKGSLDSPKVEAGTQYDQPGDPGRKHESVDLSSDKSRRPCSTQREKPEIQET